MKCGNCGFEINKKDVKFCPKCGSPINIRMGVTDDIVSNIHSGKNKNALIIAVTAIIIVLIIAATFIYMESSENSGYSNDTTSISSDSEDESVDSGDDKRASEVSSSSSSAKSWESIGSFSGSGSGSKTISVPAGQIRIDLEAFPIKNYADNHLYVSGSNGKSAGVDWGPRSAVATRSDSLSFTSNEETTFTIDYYETVSWNVVVYRYQ